MNLIFDVEIRVDGVLTDADSTPVLSDESGAFGARRRDTLAVVVADGTALTRLSTGRYQYTLASAVAQVTYEYWVEAVVSGNTYRIQKFKTAPAAADSSSYLGADEADLLAAELPGLAKYKAATAPEKAAALLMASIDVDTGLRYQGRRYDPAQELEFPRLAYDGALATTAAAAQQLGADSGYGVIWDYDSDLQAAVVPLRVRQAVLIQADSILAGDRDGRLQAISDGLLSQSVGPVAESYRAMSSPEALCRRARQIMEHYRLRQGRLL